MITTKFLKDIYAEARPIIERHLDDSELLAGLREVVAAQGGDWSSLKALITADVKDGRDEAGGCKRVKKILDKADYSAAYADMLGMANMNERNFSAEPPHDPETGEIIEPNAPRPSKRDVSTSDEPSSEVGPQAEASLAGTGTETPADREGRSSEGEAFADEAATVDRHVSASPPRGEMEIPEFLLRKQPDPAHA